MITMSKFNGWDVPENFTKHEQETKMWGVTHTMVKSLHITCEFSQITTVRVGLYRQHS